MFRLSDYLTAADGRRKADRDIVEAPIAGCLLQFCNEICGPHIRTGIKDALLRAFDHQLHVRAADIDDERLVHRLANSAELFAEADGLTEPLENTLLFLSCRASARPAFDNLKGEEPEKSHAREFQIESQIFCDLLNGTNAVELGRELRLGDGQPQILHSLKSIASVSRNRGRIIISAVADLRELDEAQRRQRPLIDIVGGERRGEVWERFLLKRKANARRAPKFGEKFLSVMLRQLHRRLVQNQILLRERDEEWAPGLLLLGARSCDPVRIDIAQRDRCFGTIELRVA